MKYLLKSLLTVATFVLLLQSCVNTDYDLDNLDRDLVFNIPPIMVGNIDAIRFAELEPLAFIPPHITIPPISVVYSYVFENFFSGNVIDMFFFEEAGTVEIYARADVSLPIPGSEIRAYFKVNDENGVLLPGVNIPMQRLTIGTNQIFRIRIDSRYMTNMYEARDLEAVLVIYTPTVTVGDLINAESYLHLRQVVVRTGGIRFEL